MSEKVFSRILARRSAICFFIICLFFLSCILRIAVVASSDYAAVQKKQSSYRLTAGKPRGTIFDCNRIPLTNVRQKILAAVSPTPRAVTALSSVLSGEELTNALERLKSKKPILCEVPKPIDCDGIVCTVVYEHTPSEPIASHVIGYTDSEQHGAAGLEYAYDSLLYTETDISVVYTIDGSGEILSGITPVFENESAITAGGVVSTLDLNLQLAAERAADALETGAVLVADAKTAKIRACVSRPNFNPSHIAEVLNAKDSPLFNRAFHAYNVGSIFKPCVAAAAIECGKSGFCYTCTGSCKIVDRLFNCHKRSGHGDMNMPSAIANSCNTFFYNFSALVGAENLYKMASALNFGKSIRLCDGLSAAGGNLPGRDMLSNPAQLANFSIGQGSLLLSPVSMLPLYCSIASDGTYYLPSLTEGTLSDGSFHPFDIGLPTRVMQPETAQMLRESLLLVVTEGTGLSAQPKTVSAAGKTATAQTGKFKNGVEICAGWFCGFFPADDPQYVVIVFSEDVNRQALSCAEIFARIADEITRLSVDK